MEPERNSDKYLYSSEVREEKSHLVFICENRVILFSNLNYYEKMYLLIFVRLGLCKYLC